jgi:DNA-binding PadR family transcriptional regulator
MMRRRKPSRQTMAVLQAFLSRPADWRYGYDLTKDIGLQSGTLYPVLMRLAEQGLLESEWHVSDRPGTPARHAYRLTPAGIVFARASIDAAAEPWSGHGIAPA